MAGSPPVCALCKEVNTATCTWQPDPPAVTWVGLAPAPRAPCPWASASGAEEPAGGGKLQGPSQRKRACDSHGLGRSGGQCSDPCGPGPNCEPGRAPSCLRRRAGARPPAAERGCLTGLSGGRSQKACSFLRPVKYLISGVCEALQKN